MKNGQAKAKLTGFTKAFAKKLQDAVSSKDEPVMFLRKDLYDRMFEAVKQAEKKDVDIEGR